ncbi:hypothetical protein K474DRAFT_1708804 [Panus rudis PR-1116 ss-1]|nr:hypothetical protein K474DRAFT_1708804 [Panus rudis PR-1116 ss-1]
MVRAASSSRNQERRSMAMQDASAHLRARAVISSSHRAIKADVKKAACDALRTRSYFIHNSCTHEGRHHPIEEVPNIIDLVVATTFISDVYSPTIFLMVPLTPRFMLAPVPARILPSSSIRSDFLPSARQQEAAFSFAHQLATRS